MYRSRRQFVPHDVHFVDESREPPIRWIVRSVGLTAVELIPARQTALIAESRHHLERLRVCTAGSSVHGKKRQF
jgi:hypothetical protein